MSARSRQVGFRLTVSALAVLGVTMRNEASTVSAPSGPPDAAAKAAAGAPPEEYGEFLARPAELASVATNDIMKSLRLSSTAKTVGTEVYNRACVSCHGADL